MLRPRVTSVCSTNRRPRGDTSTAPRGHRTGKRSRWRREENGAILAVDPATGQARVWIDSPGDESEPAFSRDGRWLAYQSNESGRDEVYVVPSSGRRGKWQVSSRGGMAPRWGPAGEIFFLAPSGELTVVKADPVGDDPHFGLAEALFAVPLGTAGASFDIARDGRILLRTKPREANTATLTLVANWPRLLEQASR